MTTTHWIRPPRPTSGEDHLATRAVCEHLYGQLLPGVTNTTERARYYTFYPWLLWALEQGGHALDRASVTRDLRRADCLFTLVGLVHGHRDAGDVRPHQERLIGVDTLREPAGLLLAGQTVRLSDYAHQDPERSKTRYLKHPYGGLGQYYLGSLEALGILGRDSDAHIPLGYTDDLGRQIAQVLDQQVPGAAFLQALRDDAVDLATVEALSPFCPCQITASAAEKAALLSVLTEGTDEGAPMRRQSLALILALAHTPEPADGALLSLGGFRAAVYTGQQPDARRAWVLPDSLEDIRQHWRQYQRNELLSLAVQALFWAGLTDHQRPEGLLDGRAWGAWMVARHRAALGWTGLSWPALLAQTRHTLPPLAAHSDPLHEVALSRAVRRLATGERATDEAREAVVAAALGILLCLCLRDEAEATVYAPFTLSPEYLTTYPINLAALRLHRQESWPGLSAEGWLAWLVTRWGVGQHLRVALRKLHTQNIDTFRLRPAEQGLVVEPFSPSVRPSFGSPRFQQTAQILTDLGLLARGPELRTFTGTPDGAALAEVLCG